MQISNHILTRARCGRGIARPPACPIEGTHAGELGNSLLYLGPAIALGGHAMLKDHGGAAFAHASDMEAAPTDIYQHLLTRRSDCCMPVLVYPVRGISLSHSCLSSFCVLAAP